MKINYTVKLLLPAITASLGTIGKDIDVEIKRDKQGNPFFSGKQVKGILRERILQFKNALNEDSKSFIKKYFGEEGNYIEKNDFSKIIFSNLTLKKDNSEKIGSRYGIRIDRRTRTTIPQSLFNYEFLRENNEFEGTLTFKDEIDKEDLKFILASLFHLDFIGGFKSRGLGRVKILINGKDIENLEKIINNLEKEEKKINKDKINNELIKYSYTLTLDEPLILKARELGNYIEVKKYLQGSTIRGALIEFFVKEGIELDKLLKIKASDATKGKVSLASLFKTKYQIPGKDKVDKAQTTVIEIAGVKLERYSEQDFSIVGNEVSIKIDPKTKSVESGMLFNSEYLSSYEKDKNQNYKKIELMGDVELPKELINKNQVYTIYIGKLKTKGFGKASIIFKDYIEKNEDLIPRINKFNEGIPKNEKEELKGKTLVTFDLQSDIVLPFNDIYDAQEQFKILANLSDKFEFNYSRSFVNTSKLEGYNLINNIRKIDELVFSRGSVFTFEIENYKDELGLLNKIEEKGIGLRKNEGFGRVKICSSRGDN
jgi:hypothetical protein